MSRKLPRKIKICFVEGCDNTFEVAVGSLTEKRKYCSKKCSYTALKGQHEERKCAYIECSNTFDVTSFTHSKKYCSSKCYGIDKTLLREVKVCENPKCNITFEVPIGGVLENTIYCSKECFYAAPSKQTFLDKMCAIGESRTLPRETRVCLNPSCDNTFEVFVGSQEKQRTFCSKECVTFRSDLTREKIRVKRFDQIIPGPDWWLEYKDFVVKASRLFNIEYEIIGVRVQEALHAHQLGQLDIELFINFVVGHNQWELSDKFGISTEKVDDILTKMEQGFPGCFQSAVPIKLISFDEHEEASREDWLSSLAIQKF